MDEAIARLSREIEETYGPVISPKDINLVPGTRVNKEEDLGFAHYSGPKRGKIDIINPPEIDGSEIDDSFFGKMNSAYNEVISPDGGYASLLKKTWEGYKDNVWNPVKNYVREKSKKFDLQKYLLFHEIEHLIDPKAEEHNVEKGALKKLEGTSAHKAAVMMHRIKRNIGGKTADTSKKLKNYLDRFDKKYESDRVFKDMGRYITKTFGVDPINFMVPAYATVGRD